MLHDPQRSAATMLFSWMLFVILNKEVPVRFSRSHGVVLSLALLSLPAIGMASCCLDDGNGKPLAKSGLGESLPVAENLSLNPNWLVYGFERDGIAYYQVNDLAGQVRVIVGHAGDQFWTLPAGRIAARTSLPSRRLAVPAAAVRYVVYQQADFALVVYGDGANAVWSVEPTGQGR
ncbi:hypothetical protein ACLB90_16680 [Stenotrophomonas sp. LGBM10]|uniref:hypothetical protein n=1 Tax=Stenotrophomonas sp. LGBM10 TaxID=3390038 RepID=UPI00398B7F57